MSFNCHMSKGVETTGPRENVPNQSTACEAFDFWRLDHTFTERNYLRAYDDYQVCRGWQNASSSNVPPRLAPPPEAMELLLDLSDAKKGELLREVFSNPFPLQVDAPTREDRGHSAAVSKPKPASRAMNQSASSASSAHTNVAPPPGLDLMIPPGIFSPPPVSERKQDTPAAATTAMRPKKRNLVSKFTAHTGDLTTLMIRNIPWRFTQQHMMEFVDEHGFKEKYDFFYVPSGARSVKSGGSNLGYAFINFHDAANAAAFTQMFQDYQFDGACSEKRVSIKPAHLQGLQANVRHFRRTSVKFTSQKPFIRQAGVQKDEASRASSCITTPLSANDNFDALMGVDPLSTLEHIEIVDDLEFDEVFE